MNKQEILLKSRKEHQDEGIEHAENQGRKMGFILFSMMSIIIMIIDSLYGYGNCISAVCALIFTFSATDSISRYKMTHKKYYLFLFVCWSLSSVLGLINFINQTMRLT